VRLPEDVVLDTDVAEEPVDLLVASEEGVQPALEPIAVAIPPRRELPARNVAPLEDKRSAPRISEVFGSGEPSRSGPYDEDVRLFDGDQMPNPVAEISSSKI
jgi:hypothetical protein